MARRCDVAVGRLIDLGECRDVCGGRVMKLEEKLYKSMILQGLSQQALAQSSGVSDSEISRLLNGRSKRPGLHNILRISKALGVSLEYLADDTLETDEPLATNPVSPEESELLNRARSLGIREATMVLEAVRILGFETAVRRLYGMTEPDQSDRLPSA